MRRYKKSKNNTWAALSFALLMGLSSLILIIILGLRINFSIYIIAFIFNCFFLPGIIIFLDRTGNKEKIWELWESFPILFHKLICAICLLWGGIIFYKALIPLLRKDYEKNK